MVEQFHDIAWRTLRRLGVAQGHLDDALRQSFLAVHAHLSEIHAGKEQSYLLRVCAGIAANTRRAQQREASLHTGYAQEKGAPGRSLEEELDAREAQRALAETLDALPAEQMLVFVLHEFEGLSGPEISEITGAPLGTVASRLRRAREAVAMHVQQKYGEKRNPQA